MIGAAVMILGWGVVLVGTIMFLIAAFKESPVWGIACLICGPAALLFIVLHFRDAIPSVFICMVGYALIVTGLVLGADLLGMFEQ